MPGRKGKPSWNAGTAKGWIDNKGYRQIQVGKRNVRYHRYLMEQHIRRMLEPWEVVHHLNGIKDDNRIENLAVIDFGEHTTLHLTGKHHSETTRHELTATCQMFWEIKRLREVNSKLYEALKMVQEDIDGDLKTKVHVSTQTFIWQALAQAEEK